MSTSGSAGNPAQTGKLSDRHDSSVYHPLRDDYFDRIDTPSTGIAEDGISFNDYDDDVSIFTANSFLDQGSPAKGFSKSDKSDLLKLVYGDDEEKALPGDDDDDEDFNEESQCLNPKQRNKIPAKSVSSLPHVSVNE